MDDTATDTDLTASQCRRRALQFLRQLAIKRSILPPSLFLNNLKREGINGVRRAVGGGAYAVSFVSLVLRVVSHESQWQYIYKNRIQGKVFCFRALRMFFTAKSLGERDKLYKVTFSVADH